MMLHRGCNPRGCSSATDARPSKWPSQSGQDGQPPPSSVSSGRRGTGTPQARSVCGPVPPSPAPVIGLPRDQVERIAATALAEPNRHAAVRFLQEVLPEADSQLPGVRNIGLVASHELQFGVPARRDWQDACGGGAQLLGLRGRPLDRSGRSLIDRVVAPEPAVDEGTGR